MTCIFASYWRFHGDCYDDLGFLQKFMILASNESENWEHFQFSLIEKNDRFEVIYLSDFIVCHVSEVHTDFGLISNAMYISNNI